MKSDHLGKVGVGRQSMVSDNIAILVDGSGSLVPANWVTFDVNAFTIFRKNGASLVRSGAALVRAAAWWRLG